MKIEFEHNQGRSASRNCKFARVKKVNSLISVASTEQFAQQKPITIHPK